MKDVTTQEAVLTPTARRAVVRPMLAALAVGAALGLALSVIAPAAGSVDSAHARKQRCTDDTIRGSYGFLVTGTRGTGPGVTEPIVGSGIVTYDGRGGFQIVDNVHGQNSPAVLGRVVNGSYAVAPNCTGTATIFLPDLPFDIHTTFVVVDGGEEILEAVMSPQPAMVTSRGRRI